MVSQLTNYFVIANDAANLSTNSSKIERGIRLAATQSRGPVIGHIFLILGPVNVRGWEALTPRSRWRTPGIQILLIFLRKLIASSWSQHFKHFDWLTKFESKMAGFDQLASQGCQLGHTKKKRQPKHRTVSRNITGNAVSQGKKFHHNRPRCRQVLWFIRLCVSCD